MCDSMLAVGEETAGGAALFAKNSDRKARECQPFLQFAEASHPPAARVRCSHIEIPQVPATQRVMGHSPHWVWGFEHGVNEHALAIGNQTVFSKEPLDEEPGLIGMDLVRLALERARSAREAVDVIAELLERHGQGGSALAPGVGGYHNGFTIVDASEAWVLETSNRHWAARRTRLESLSNHMCLGDDWEIGSPDLEDFARERGWWTQASRLDVARAYRELRIPRQISEGRQRRGRELMRAGRGKHDVASMQRVLRDHLDAGESWRPGPGFEDEAFFTLCAHSGDVHWTTASIATELPARTDAPWPVWISFGTPCTGIFLPVYLHGVIPAALAVGGAEPEDGSAWWHFKRLQDAVGADWPRHTRAVRSGWADLEQGIETQRVEAEAAARAAIDTGDRDRAAGLLTDFMQRCVDAALERADLLRARIEH